MILTNRMSFAANGARLRSFWLLSSLLSRGSWRRLSLLSAHAVHELSSGSIL